MAKKSMVAKQLKRQTLVNKFKTRRLELKKALKEATSYRELYEVQVLMQELPRDSSATRLKNRCLMTGRPKAYYRHFGLSRHMLRRMAHQGLLPGVTKASW